jgi:DNA-dependent RNA polymerase auxiliary subunit epsilon
MNQVDPIPNLSDFDELLRKEYVAVENAFEKFRDATKTNKDNERELMQINLMISEDDRLLKNINDDMSSIAKTRAKYLRLRQSPHPTVESNLKEREFANISFFNSLTEKRKQDLANLLYTNGKTLGYVKALEKTRLEYEKAIGNFSNKLTQKVESVVDRTDVSLDALRSRTGEYLKDTESMNDLEKRIGEVNRDIHQIEAKMGDYDKFNQRPDVSSARKLVAGLDSISKMMPIYQRNNKIIYRLKVKELNETCLSLLEE